MKKYHKMALIALIQPVVHIFSNSSGSN